MSDSRPADPPAAARRPSRRHMPCPSKATAQARVGKESRSRFHFAKRDLSRSGPTGRRFLPSETWVQRWVSNGNCKPHLVFSAQFVDSWCTQVLCVHEENRIRVESSRPQAIGPRVWLTDHQKHGRGLWYLALHVS